MSKIHMMYQIIHFMRKEKLPEVQIYMNSWALKNGLADDQGPRSKKMERSRIKGSVKEI